jgi:hypothetical protein
MDLSLVEVIVIPLVWASHSHNDKVFALIETEIVDRWFEEMRFFF